MNISFGQIYPEIDTDFSLTNTVLIELKTRINSINQSFQTYESIFNTRDFSTNFIVSATRKNDILIVDGPTILKKNKTIEFVLHIPYKKLSNFTEEMNYVLDFIGEGLHLTFKKNHADSEEINTMIDNIKKLIITDPDKYKKWTK
jgi:hypothetical protein